MADILSLEAAARHLRFTSDEYEDAGFATSDVGLDIQSKLDMAEGLVLDYLKKPDNPDEWSEADAPPPVKAAILLTLSDLYEHRAGSAEDDVFLSLAVRNILHRLRDPALA